MALGLRDEEEYSLGGLNNLSNLGESNLGLGNLKGLENIGNNSLSLGDGWGSGKKNDPLATSWDNFKIQFGGGLQTLDDILNKDSFLSQWGEAMEESGEIGKEDYMPKFTGTFLEQEGFAGKLQWAVERAKENAVGSGAALASIILTRRLEPAYGILGFLQLNEAGNVHAENAEKPVTEFSDSEKVNTTFAAAMMTVLDLYTPLKVGKAFSPLMKKDLKEMASYLNDFEKMGFANAIMIGLKKAGVIGLIEGGTEVAQDAIAQFTSATRGRDMNVDASSGAFATGVVGGTTLGSIAGYRDATQPKREAKQYQRELDEHNLSQIQKASDEFGIQVTEYEKKYQDLLDKYEGPELQSRAAVLKKNEGTFKDVVPETIDFKRLPQTKLSALTTGAADFLLSKSTDEIERTTKQAKTGEDYFRLNRVLRGFAPAESGSGDSQSNLSFHSLKQLNVGEFVVPYTNIKDRWESSYPAVGKLGSKVGQDIDTYFGQAMEKKIDPTLESRVRKQLGETKFNILRKDIAETRKNYNKVHASLKKSLGRDGMEIGYIKDYLTRGFDKAAVKANPKRFLDILGESYIDANGVRQKGVNIKDTKTRTAEEIKQQILNDVLNGVDPTIMTSEQIRNSNNRGGVNRPGFEHNRDARFNRVPDEFRSKSPMNSINDYLMNASTRLASADSFGANKANRLNDDINHLLSNKVIGNKEAQKMWDLYDAVHHTFKRPQDDAGRLRQDIMRGVAAGATFKYLGMATISSITEPAWIIQRNGIVNTLKAAPTMAVHALAGMKRSLYSGGVGKGATSNFARDLNRVLGFALDPKNTERNEKMFAGDSNKWVNVFFRMPAGLFLTQYTNFVRGWAGTAALKRIQSEAKALKRMKPARRKRLEAELRENGMTIEDFSAVYRAGGNKIDILNEDFLNTTITKSDGTQTRVRDMMLPWLRKMVTDVALEPLATNRPLWMSNPDYQLFAQLKSFPILFGNTIAKRAIRKMNPKTCTPDLMGQMSTLAAIGTALAAAALAMAIKDEIRGSDFERGPLDYVGAIGVPLINESSPSSYILGPVAGLLDDFMGSLYGEGLSETMAKGPEEFYDLILRSSVGALGVAARND
jgi:hypothetical protein